MKIRPILVAVAGALFASCANSATVKVVDAHNKAPVAGARVTAVRGNLSSESVVTDSTGEAPEPTLPGGAKALVISGAGYSTKTISLNQ